MSPSPLPPSTGRDKSSPTLFFILLGLIVASILAFLIIRPNPSGQGSNHTNTDSAAPHAAPSK